MDRDDARARLAKNSLLELGANAQSTTDGVSPQLALVYFISANNLQDEAAAPVNPDMYVKEEIHQTVRVF